MPQDVQEPRKRGLGALLSSTVGATAEGLREVAVDLIDPSPQQPRMEFDDGSLQELADSIRNNGVLQPVLLRPAPGGRYFLIAGERRWRASRLAGLTRLPAVIRDSADFEALELSLVENIQREDLNSIETAKAYRLLADHFERTQDEIAHAVGKDRSTVANTLRLLELPLSVQNLLSEGRLTPGHARALLAVGTERKREELATRIVKQGLSVRRTEQLAYGRGKATKKSAERTPLEERLTEFFGYKVRLERGRRKSRLSIEFQDNNDLDAILEKLGISNE